MIPIRQLLIRTLNGTSRSHDFKQVTEADWIEFLSSANALSVIPLIYQQVKSFPDIPSDVMEKMYRVYLGTIFRNTQLYHAGSDLLTALHEKGIHALLLKGMHLAELVYQDIGLRPMSDLDILVQKEKLNLTIQTLFQIGFCINKKEPEFRIHGNEIPLSFNHYPTLVHRKTDIHLDVHCSILYENSPFHPDVDGIFKRARSAVICGKEALTMHPEDLLLHVCIHTAFLNLFSNGLRALCDIRETIQHYQEDIDWKRLSDRARQWGVMKSFQLTLYLAKEYLNAKVPDWVMSSMSYDPERVVQARHNLFSTSCSLEFLPSRYADLEKRKSMLLRLVDILKILFPKKDKMAVIFLIPKDSVQIYFGYPRRILQYGVRVFRRMVQKKMSLSETAQREKKNFDLKKWLAED